MQWCPAVQNHPDDWSATNRQILQTGSDLEFGLVDLVLAASECSDDEMEIQDLVDGLIDCGNVYVDGI